MSNKPADDQAFPEDSLKKLQAYVWQKSLERGFDTTDLSKKLVMLMEETGELAKAVRKAIGMKFTDTTAQTDLREELADVQIVLLGLAGIAGIDMFEAVKAKESKNQKRTWR